MDEELVEFIEKQGGNFILSYNNGYPKESRWTAGIHFGAEGPESNIFGGSAFGLASTAEQAIAGMKREAGIGRE